jgi:hypothetical protein
MRLLFLLGFLAVAFASVDLGSALDFSAAKKLLSFDPQSALTIASEQLQDASLECKTAFGILVQNLQDKRCNPILGIFTYVGDPTWNAGDHAYLINQHCYVTNCSAVWQSDYDYMMSMCSQFPSTSDLATSFGPNVESIVREILIVHVVPCLNNSGNYTAPPSTALHVPSMTYPVKYCWIDFSALVQTNTTYADTAYLDARCTDCARRVYAVLRGLAPQELVAGAKAAINFCVKKLNDATQQQEYCYPKILALRAWQANNPKILAELGSANLTDLNSTILDMFCDKCIVWGIRQQTRLQYLLGAVNSSAYNATLYAELQNVTSLLQGACLRDTRDDVYCDLKLRAWQANGSPLTQLTPCVNAILTPTTCPDSCKQIILQTYDLLGCCLVLFLRSWKTDPELMGFYTNGLILLKTCTVDPLPTTCTNKVVITTLVLNNTLLSWINGLNDTTKANYFAFAVSADPVDILSTNCWGSDSTATATAICNVTFNVGSTSEADDRAVDIQSDVQNGVFSIVDLDFANSTIRPNPALPAYDAASVSVTTNISCVSAAYPAGYHYYAANNSCVPDPNPADQNTHNSASTVSMNLFIYVVALVGLLLL